ncbi:ABC transporter substrate-binding protein [Thalassotalea sp. G2M2-11]|uniref:ABC transporter substrate-binding protein n=1 Tax=Thalassotalea sp. G2M2-11 TaxID=2787627 RepID=UPI0019D08F3A|nr:ABC transporter substrate-binding protein [Thalassotalea sp. G2M2-11]
MTKNNNVKAIVFLLATLFYIKAFAINIVLVNPDKIGRPFWDFTTMIATKAADELNVNLDVRYGGGNRFENLKIIEEISKSKDKPDYVIFLPHKGKAEQYFNLLERANIHFISLERSMGFDEISRLKHPGEKYKYWLSEVFFDDKQAGRLLATKLLDRAPNEAEKHNFIIGISGAHSALSSNREQGLHEVITKNDVFLQTVKTMWDPTVASQKLAGLIKRYPETNVIWTASDELALAAQKKIKELSHNHFDIGGIGGIPEAVISVKNKQLTATVAGHYMQAAWAVIMAYDHSLNVDIEILAKPLSYNIITADNVDTYIKTINPQNWNKVNFRQFSLAETNKNNYNFDLNKLVGEF